MSGELVARLRDQATAYECFDGMRNDAAPLREAADRIEELERENKTRWSDETYQRTVNELAAAIMDKSALEEAMLRIQDLSSDGVRQLGEINIIANAALRVVA